jgi:hypothetical protein
MSKKLKQPQGRRGDKNQNGWLRNGNRPSAIRALPKCQARAKSTGARCGNLAVKGKRVCWIHGGRSPGAPRKNENALKNGRYRSTVIVERKSVRSITKRLLATISAITKMAEELRKTKKKGGEYAFNNDQEKLEDES